MTKTAMIMAVFLTQAFRLNMPTAVERVISEKINKISHITRRNLFSPSSKEKPLCFPKINDSGPQIKNRALAPPSKL